MEELYKKKSRATGIIGGTLSLTLSTVIVKLLGVVYKIPLAHILGEEGMGYFNSAYTVYAFFYLLCTAGVPKAVMILISEQRAKNIHGGAERIVSVAMRLFFGLGILITTLFIIFSTPLANLIGNSESRLTMISIAPSILFISLAGVVRGYLSADMKFLSIAVSQIVEGVGKLVLGLIFAIYATRLELPLPIVSAMTILGVTFGAVFGFAYLYVAAKFKRGKKSAEAKGREIIRRIFRISVPITISAAIMSITNIIDLSLIMQRLRDSGYSQKEATALFGNYTTLAVPMLNLAISVITPISIAFLPILTRAHAKGDRELQNSALKSALSMSFFFSAPIMLGMMVFSSEILSLLFGDVGISVGAPLLTLLAPSIFFMAALLVVNSLLESVGVVRAPVISMLIGSTGKIIVSAVLLGNPDFGISGAPLGTLISYLLALISSLVIAKIKCKTCIPIFSTCILPHINALGAILVSILLNNFLKTVCSQNIAFIITFLGCAALYLLFSCISGVASKEKLQKMSKYTKPA